MFRKQCIFVLLMFSHKLTAQNLVPNPGFELMHSCSETFVHSSIENTENWFNSIEQGVTVDWYADCFCSIPGSFYCPPNLYFGSSAPHSGTAMIGMCPYSEITHTGESVGIRLSEPLKKDSAYCYGFWTKNSKNHNAVYSIREFNIVFLPDTSGIDDYSEILNYQTINNISNDEAGEWHYLSNYYIANGGEEYIILGVFDQAPNYYLEGGQTPEKKIYYYFDDFSLTPCNKDSLLEVTCELPNVFTVNNDNINEIYRPQLRNISKLEIQVFNRWGNLVRSYDGLTEVWDGTDNSGIPLTENVYYVRAVAESKFGDKLEKSQFVHLIRE